MHYYDEDGNEYYVRRRVPTWAKLLLLLLALLIAADWLGIDIRSIWTQDQGVQYVEPLSGMQPTAFPLPTQPVLPASDAASAAPTSAPYFPAEENLAQPQAPVAQPTVHVSGRDTAPRAGGPSEGRTTQQIVDPRSPNVDPSQQVAPDLATCQWYAAQGMSDPRCPVVTPATGR